jgi:hypothetical protein
MDQHMANNHFLIPLTMPHWHPTPVLMLGPPVSTSLQTTIPLPKGNMFCFSAFADKHTGTLYNNLTGSFPFMSLDRNMCYLIVYHYETNAILAIPIANLEDTTIFEGYKKQFEFLGSKGHKLKLNIMDNQASRQIKWFLTQNECDLILVEPHSHHVNAAKHAIQTVKVHFVSALATTDSEFSLQLWDCLTSQIKALLNLPRRSQIDPSKSAYKALYGPYDWN